MQSGPPDAAEPAKSRHEPPAVQTRRSRSNLPEQHGGAGRAVAAEDSLWKWRWRRLSCSRSGGGGRGKRNEEARGRLQELESFLP
jgi:hypothetical protein